MEVVIVTDAAKATSLPYISFDQQVLNLTQAECADLVLSFSSAVWEAEEFLVVDIYSAANPVHPQGHVGWWKWPLHEKRDLGVRIIKSADGFKVAFEGQTPKESWTNPNFRGLDTDVLEVHLVLRQA